MDIGNFEFRQGFTREVQEVGSFGFEKCLRDFLETLLTLQEVGKLPTLIYFPFGSHLWLCWSPRCCLVFSRTQNNVFSGFLG